MNNLVVVSSRNSDSVIQNGEKNKQRQAWSNLSSALLGEIRSFLPLEDVKIHAVMVRTCRYWKDTLLSNPRFSNYRPVARFNASSPVLVKEFTLSKKERNQRSPAILVGREGISRRTAGVFYRVVMENETLKVNVLKSKHPISFQLSFGTLDVFSTQQTTLLIYHHLTGKLLQTVTEKHEGDRKTAFADIGYLPEQRETHIASCLAWTNNRFISIKSDGTISSYQIDPSKKQPCTGSTVLRKPFSLPEKSVFSACLVNNTIYSLSQDKGTTTLEAYILHEGVNISVDQDVQQIFATNDKLITFSETMVSGYNEKAVREIEVPSENESFFVPEMCKVSNDLILSVLIKDQFPSACSLRSSSKNFEGQELLDGYYPIVDSCFTRDSAVIVMQREGLNPATFLRTMDSSSPIFGHKQLEGNYIVISDQTLTLPILARVVGKSLQIFQLKVLNPNQNRSCVIL